MVLVVAVLVAERQRSGVRATWIEVRRADVLWLLVAVALCGALFVLLGLLHATTQHAAGTSVPLWRAVRLASSAQALNMVSKSGGMAGLGPFLADAQRARRSRGQTVAGYVLASVLAELAFLLTLVIGIVVLSAEGRLTRDEGVALGAFLLLLGARLTMVLATVHSEARIRRVHRVAGRISSFVRRRPPDLAQRDLAIADLREAVGVLHQRPAATVPGIVVALGVQVVGIGMLAAVLAAVRGPGDPTIPLVAYVISVMFSIIAFLPGGLGFVEVSLGALLVSFDYSTGKAAAAVALYRLLQLWVPVVVGFVASRGMRTP